MPRFPRDFAAPGPALHGTPCLTCGACCAYFRVSFHWSEADPALGGRVPIELTDALRTHERVMRGTSQSQPRCIALDADIGRYSRCSIHDRRPRPARPCRPRWNSGSAVRNAINRVWRTACTH